MMLLKSIYNKNLCFNEQKCIFEHCGKIKTIEFYVILKPIFFWFKKMFYPPFQNCPLEAN